MAKPLIGTIRVAMIVVSTFASLLMANSGIAQTLTDPTRPPLLKVHTHEHSGGVSNAEPVLQSVLIAPGRKEATISGKMVRVGDKYKGASVVHIDESEVVLRSGGHMKTLKLFPAVDRRASHYGPRVPSGSKN